MIKKIVWFTFMGLFVISFIPVKAQFEITPYTGWMLGGRRYEYKIEDGQNYGLTVGFNAGEVKYIFLYNRMDSKLTKNTPFEGKVKLTDMATEYFNLGALKEVHVNDMVAPFGLFTMGAVVFTPKNSNYYTEWMFSAILGGGLRIYPIKNFAIQLQARMLMPMRFGGGGFWCGTGGCSIGAGTYSTIVQGDFTGGIVISF